MEPICIKCEREWAGDYPVCMLCAPDTHFPHRSDCIHCEMLTDLQSKDRAFELMLEALEALTAVISRSVLTPILTAKAAVQQAVDQANAAIAAAKGEQ